MSFKLGGRAGFGQGWGGGGGGRRGKKGEGGRMIALCIMLWQMQTSVPPAILRQFYARTLFFINRT